MQIVRYTTHKTKKPAYGVLNGTGIIPIKGAPFDRDIICTNKTVSKHDASFLPPCIPTKIVALAANYRGATGQTAGMQEPVIFLKGPNSIAPVTDTVEIPFPEKVWGEPELAIVIKKRAKHVKPAEVSEHILGYLPANDISTENIHGRDHHLARSKSADGFCPVGMYIDTDYNPARKTITAYHNTTLLRQGNTSDMVWGPEETVSRISQWMTLFPGDIILTGTPPRIRDRLYIKNGDTFTVDIEGFPPFTTRFHVRQQS